VGFVSARISEPGAPLLVADSSRLLEQQGPHAMEIKKKENTGSGLDSASGVTSPVIRR